MKGQPRLTNERYANHETSNAIFGTSPTSKAAAATIVLRSMLRGSAQASVFSLGLITATLALGVSSLRTTEPPPAVDEVLLRMAPTAELYLNSALEFSCVETVRWITYEAGQARVRGKHRSKRNRIIETCTHIHNACFKCRKSGARAEIPPDLG